MNISNPSGPGYVDYSVPAGSRIEMVIRWQRLGTGDGNRSCERRIYDLNVTLSSSASYDNMYDWFVGENVQLVLNDGTQEVGDGQCDVTNTFLPTLSNSLFPTGFGDLCTNYLQFIRDLPTNRLFLGISGTVRCNGATGKDKRRSSITARITAFRADNTLIFETEPLDTLPDVFFENDLSFPIDAQGNHLSNGAAGDISQDITAGTPGYIQT